MPRFYQITRPSCAKHPLDKVRTVQHITLMCKINLVDALISLIDVPSHCVSHMAVPSLQLLKDKYFSYTCWGINCLCELECLLGEIPSLYCSTLYIKPCVIYIVLIHEHGTDSWRIPCSFSSVNEMFSISGY